MLESVCNVDYMRERETEEATKREGRENEVLKCNRFE